VAGALIITAELGAEDQAQLDRLRRAHYPVERNRLPAHLTMFHALPPSSEAEVRSRLSRVADERRPNVMIDGIMDLGGGVAFRIVSTDLDRIRMELASGFHGLLSAQDAGGWRPHVTIQNKVSPKTARALAEALRQDFRPKSIAIRGLGLHRYEDGPWQQLAIYPFRAT
jgi:hypothetical protein